MSGEKEQELPLGWVSVPLSAIARINPSLDRSVLNDDVEVTFLPMRAVEAEGGGVRSPEVRRFGEVKKGYTSFLTGDVIMAKITPCMENGKTTVVPDVPGQVCFGSTEFHSIRPEQGVQAKWIAQFLLRHATRRAGGPAERAALLDSLSPQEPSERPREPATRLALPHSHARPVSAEMATSHRSRLVRSPFRQMPSAERHIGDARRRLASSSSESRRQLPAALPATKNGPDSIRGEIWKGRRGQEPAPRRP